MAKYTSTYKRSLKYIFYYISKWIRLKEKKLVHIDFFPSSYFELIN